MGVGGGGVRLGIEAGQHGDGDAQQPGQHVGRLCVGVCVCVCVCVRVRVFESERASERGRETERGEGVGGVRGKRGREEGKGAERRREWGAEVSAHCRENGG